MNILPKKNWHVRTKKNIEKVKKDEAKAAEEERKLQARIDLAEREARINFLRKKAKGTDDAVTDPKRLMVDIFSDAKEGKADKRINVEHEKEEKARKEKWEERVGILTYLHKNNDDVDKPWYLQPHDTRMTQDQAAQERKEREKRFVVPLITMNRYLRKMKTTAPGPDRQAKRVKTYESHPTSSQAVSSVEEQKGSVDIQKLRQERLNREAKEREKSHKLMAQFRGHSVRDSRSRDVDERKLRFNSQFNPHLAKQ